MEILWIALLSQSTYPTKPLESDTKSILTRTNAGILFTLARPEELGSLLKSKLTVNISYSTQGRLLRNKDSTYLIVKLKEKELSSEFSIPSLARLRSILEQNTFP